LSLRWSKPRSPSESANGWWWIFFHNVPCMNQFDHQIPRITWTLCRGGESAAISSGCAGQLDTSCRSFQNMPLLTPITSWRQRKKQHSHTFTDHRTSGGINRSSVPTPKHPRNHFGYPNKNQPRKRSKSRWYFQKPDSVFLGKARLSQAMSHLMGQRWGTPKNMGLEVLVSFLVSKKCDCWY
jgi:hypothetical protein